MNDDRFRPDAAARRVMPSATKPSAANQPRTGSIFRDHPRVGFKGLAYEEDRIVGNRGDRVIVDDPKADEEVEKAVHTAIKDGVVAGLTSVAVAALFEPTKPIAQVGRNSIPKSHRGEGLNYVD